MVAAPIYGSRSCSTFGPICLGPAFRFKAPEEETPSFRMNADGTVGKAVFDRRLGMAASRRTQDQQSPFRSFDGVGGDSGQLPVCEWRAELHDAGRDVVRPVACSERISGDRAGRSQAVMNTATNPIRSTIRKR